VSAQHTPKVRCGDCALFLRDGKCKFFETPEGRAKDRPFTTAPFWVWSDCYSDKELVRADVETTCSTFKAKTTGSAS
jgi:hypothetical protein